MAAAADATTAMTIDFLRARLLSERSVSRAAKERADQLAMRVAELEDQLRTVTAQRRKAERAAAEVLAILDSQGFGRLSDATDDSGSDADAEGPGAAEVGRGGGNARGDAPEDAMSGSELGVQGAAAAQAGGLSWKGRAAGPDWDRRRPQQQQQKGRHLRQQRHGNGHRRGYFYSRADDSSPKYHPGQSCRKIKKKELRSQTTVWEGKDDIAGESAEEGQERSDCTVCTDEPDLVGEVSQDGQNSSSNERVQDGRDQYDMDCGKDGEMERVLEKQAELIGQYEAEENAQREWEKKFSESRDSTVDSVNLCNKLDQIKSAYGEKETAQMMDQKVISEQTGSSKNNLFGINKLSEYLPKDSAIEECKVVKSDHDLKSTATGSSSNGELQVSKDVLATKSYPETVERTSNKLENSAPSPQGICDSSLNAEDNKGQRDGNSDSCSIYNANAHSSEHNINTPSVGSPSSDTPKSEVSEWSSSCFHNHTDNLLDMQMYQSSSNDVGSVLEALQRAKMSLREKLSRPSPPRQNLLALPAPEDRFTEDDFPVNEMQLSVSRSTLLSQEMLALEAPAYYLNRIAPQDNTNIQVGHAGLFRVPTDSFPTNWMASSDGCSSRFSLTGATATQFNTSPCHAVNHIGSTSPFSRYGSGCYPHLLPVPTAGGCSIPESDFRIEGASFLPETRRPQNDLIRGEIPSGDAGMLFQYE